MGISNHVFLTKCFPVGTNQVQNMNRTISNKGGGSAKCDVVAVFHRLFLSCTQFKKSLSNHHQGRAILLLGDLLKIITLNCE